MAVALDTPVADFQAEATSGQAIKLSELNGQQVVIYFYPKDSTPGCTTEGQGFRDLYPAFHQRHGQSPQATADGHLPEVGELHQQPEQAKTTPDRPVARMQHRQSEAGRRHRDTP